MIVFSIDLSKIDEKFITIGKDGKKYADFKLVETPDSPYGHDFMVCQSLDKATRAKAKETTDWPKTPIVGNGKNLGEGERPAPQQQQQTFTTNLQGQQVKDLPF